jgi:hypothetical protein
MDYESVWNFEMDLDQQIQSLIDDAPKDGSTPALVEAIAPVLKQFAERLRHSQYYIVQTVDQEWAITMFANNAQPDEEKTVVYAYPTLKDVSQAPYPMQDPLMMALPVPVTHILFQMLAMDAVNSTIFFEVPGDTSVGTEIQREELTYLVQTHLQNQMAPQSSIPPDIA